MNQPTRRTFLKTASAAVAASSLGSIAAGAHAAGDDTLKVGLIGCGGRGTGAAAQALNAHPKNVLVAMADAFGDKLESSLNVLKGQGGIAERVQVDDGGKHVGIDGYKKLIEQVDVVLMATPPHFRPEHVRAAVEAGKHCFVEKPVSVDGPGTRSILESTEMAAKKGLTIVSGLCWRYHPAKRETIARIHDGEIGEITAMRCSYLTRGLWSHARQPGWSDLDFQMRNWLYYTWLSGDHTAEQHIHSLDKTAWAMHDVYPTKVSGVGGRIARTADIYGHVYDHFAVEFEYETGLRTFSRCRQQNGTDVDVTDHVYGTKGYVDVMAHRQFDLNGNQVWRYKGPNANMYQVEHNEMFAAIRAGEPINNGEYMAKSTLMAIAGRESAYSGKTITLDSVLNSETKLGPADYSGAVDFPKTAIPGVTSPLA